VAPVWRTTATTRWRSPGVGSASGETPLIAT